MNTPNTTKINSSDSGGFSEQMFPAGLTNKKAEIFSDGKSLKGTYNGKVTTFAELPSLIKLHFALLYSEAIEQDAKTKTVLNKVFNPANYTEELELFVRCNYGGFDNNPDFNAEKKPKKEYWNCGHRGKCLAEGIVCRPDCICKYKLTIRETEIIKHIADGKVACEVSARLGIEENTVRTHEAHIKTKLGIHTRGEIIKFAFLNNILL